MLCTVRNHSASVLPKETAIMCHAKLSWVATSTVKLRGEFISKTNRIWIAKAFFVDWPRITLMEMCVQRWMENVKCLRDNLFNCINNLDRSFSLQPFGRAQQTFSAEHLQRSLLLVSSSISKSVVKETNCFSNKVKKVGVESTCFKHDWER